MPSLFNEKVEVTPYGRLPLTAIECAAEIVGESIRLRLGQRGAPVPAPGADTVRDVIIAAAVATSLPL